MKETEDVLGLNLFEWRIGSHINDPTFRVQLSDRVLADVGALTKLFIWNDLV